MARRWHSKSNFTLHLLLKTSTQNGNISIYMNPGNSKKNPNPKFVNNICQSSVNCGLKWRRMLKAKTPFSCSWAAWKNPRRYRILRGWIETPILGPMKTVDMCRLRGYWGPEGTGGSVPSHKMSWEVGWWREHTTPLYYFLPQSPNQKKWDEKKRKNTNWFCSKLL